MIRNRLICFFLKNILRLRTPAALLDFAVRRYGDKPIFYFAAETRSAEDLYRESGRLLSYFCKQQIGKGRVVAVLLDNIPEYLDIRFACYRGGQIFSALLDDFTPDRILEKLIALDPGIFIFDNRISAEQLQAIIEVLPETTLLYLGSQKTPDYSRHYSAVLPDSGTQPGKINIKPEDISAVGFTSGTTGPGKGVVWNHRGWTESFYHFLLNSGKNKEPLRLLQMMPFSTVGSLTILPALMTGSETTVLTRFDCQKAAETLCKKKITHTVLPPSFLYRLYSFLQTNPGRYPMEHLRSLSCGSAVLSESKWRMMNPVFNNAVVQSYGMAEVLAPLTTHCFIDDTESLRSSGKPIKQVEIDLLETDFQNQGRIRLCSSTCFLGYWGLELRDSRRERTFVSEDWGSFNSRDEIVVLGREQDRIEYDGRNLFIRDLEEPFHRIPEICDVRIRITKRVLTAEVLPMEGKTLLPEDIIREVRSEIPPEISIGEILIVNDIPLSSSGKKRRV